MPSTVYGLILFVIKNRDLVIELFTHFEDMARDSFILYGCHHYQCFFSPFLSISLFNFNTYIYLSYAEARCMLLSRIFVILFE
jgi:hypothetical protein